MIGAKLIKSSPRLRVRYPVRSRHTGYYLKAEVKKSRRKSRDCDVTRNMTSPAVPWYTSKALRYGSPSQGISQFYLHTSRTSADGMNHTCLCLPSRSWCSFSDPGGIEGWVGLGSYLTLKAARSYLHSSGQNTGMSCQRMVLSAKCLVSELVCYRNV